MPNGHTTEPDKHQSLAHRFDQRAIRLRRDANVFLAIIIAVLVGGAAAFVLANDITNLTFRPQTAEAQYVAAAAALKEIKAKQEPIRKQIKEITDRSSISMPFDEKIKTAIAELSAFEDDLLKTCTNISSITTNSPPPVANPGPESQISLSISRLYSNLTVMAAEERIGDYKIVIPDKTVYFSSPDSAQKCGSQFVNALDKSTEYLKRIQYMVQERDQALANFFQNKQGEVAKMQEQLQPLTDEEARLQSLIKEIQGRVTQERVLDAPLTPGENRDSATVKSDTKNKPDWARVIETNATRIGALATMFFLVTILVPQYRYNIRMASFYEARADSIRFLPDTDARGPEDLGKIVNIMTPNIDFGKAPPTPWDQIIEMIKTAKS